MDLTVLAKSYTILIIFFPVTLFARILVEIEVILLLVIEFDNILFGIF